MVTVILRVPPAVPTVTACLEHRGGTVDAILLYGQIAPAPAVFEPLVSNLPVLRPVGSWALLKKKNPSVSHVYRLFTMPESDAEKGP